MTDELYLCPVFEDDVLPLLRSDYDFVDENFYSANLAVAGEMYSREGWQHPQGLQPGGLGEALRRQPHCLYAGRGRPEAYANPQFQRLVHNAVRWVASPEAQAWATVFISAHSRREPTSIGQPRS